ncbi:hypothetical protein RI844_11620 [Thalassotalea fonticola]|uniref:DUF1573 domain-containing protein n=1 Tax=Thalassotalea fonticola TaxID=3065649 RepID=A0ABZ0GJV0_9GAMM|nr:hypothetical protein RI844_11620 [Colwelliaceae bacterium S1-1]
MKIIQSLSKMITLASLTISTTAFANLEISKERVYFPVQLTDSLATQAESVTIFNNYASTVDLTGAIAIATKHNGDAIDIDDINAENITYDASNCDEYINGTPMPVDGQCSIVFTYEQIDHNFQAILLEISDPTSGTLHPIFVSNYVEETTASEAARRLSPLVEQAEIFTAADTEFNSPLSTISAAGVYVLRWNVVTYGDVNSKVVLYHCGSSADDSCAASEDGSEPGSNYTVIDASTVAAAQSSTLADYSYSGEQASLQQFSATLTLPSSVTSEVLALRFFHITPEDSDDGLTNNISSSLAGAIDFMSQGNDGYYGSAGRRLNVNTTP